MSKTAWRACLDKHISIQRGLLHNRGRRIALGMVLLQSTHCIRHTEPRPKTSTDLTTSTHVPLMRLETVVPRIAMTG
ncbi:hypothetical protein JMJ77_0004139 [Colletotrichum scovillei]|uniref:Uncharacterized protein n=1 Tax=Colletotrichum scovillei TaxID=1209932 RepID=A0A9P7QYR4_9PEZI|nr:hypothetical protein JMJ77_0004139 [Colletotrichum scovillei]KAG7049387.1 hypothetical protein JMJ78_0013370 [Colletotrichum scovillei]KAG7064130.1 hypothetical protein JMJ76_0007178 [Colletotrichum scovillei]